MLLNLIYFSFILIMCVSRFNNWCPGCEGNKWLDIFQIGFVGVVSHLLVGGDKVLLLIFTILTSFIFKSLYFLFASFFKKKEPELKKKCKNSNCIDPWI